MYIQLLGKSRRLRLDLYEASIEGNGSRPRSRFGFFDVHYAINEGVDGLVWSWR